jgi:hypothetical protein
MSELESPQHPLPPVSGRSQRTFTSTGLDRDFDSDLGLSPGPSNTAGLAAPFDSGLDGGSGGIDDGVEDGEQDEAVHFCLLAEFDIDAGATLADQYPHPTGTDEQ